MGAAESGDLWWWGRMLYKWTDLWPFVPINGHFWEVWVDANRQKLALWRHLVMSRGFYIHLFSCFGSSAGEHWTECRTGENWCRIYFRNKLSSNDRQRKSFTPVWHNNLMRGEKRYPPHSWELTPPRAVNSSDKFMMLQLGCVGVTSLPLCPTPAQPHPEPRRRRIMMGRKSGDNWAVFNSGKILLEEVDESVGGRVVGVDLCGVLQLRLDLLSKLLAQFNPDGAEERK